MQAEKQADRQTDVLERCCDTNVRMGEHDFTKWLKPLFLCDFTFWYCDIRYRDRALIGERQHPPPPKKKSALFKKFNAPPLHTLFVMTIL